jgi:hypothetical protein
MSLSNVPIKKHISGYPVRDVWNMEKIKNGITLILISGLILAIFIR